MGVSAIPAIWFGFPAFVFTFTLIMVWYYRRGAFSSENVAKLNAGSSNKPGFFSSAGKNIVGGAMLGKGLSDTFMSKGVSGKNHYRCGNCGFEKMAIVSPNSCPKCKTYGKLMEL